MNPNIGESTFSKSLSRRDFIKLAALSLGSVVCQVSCAIPTLTPGKVAITSNQPSPTIYKFPTTALRTKEPPPTPIPPDGLMVTSTSTLQPSLNPSPMDSPIPMETTSSQPSSMPFPAFLIDGHEDIAWNYFEFLRDPTQSAISSRTQEETLGLPYLIGQRTAGLPEWLIGRVGFIFATIFVMPTQHAYASPWNKITYTTPPEAENKALEQLDYYHQLVNLQPRMRLIRSYDDMKSVISTWKNVNSSQEGIVGLILLMEGADPIVSPNDLSRWYDAGLRLIGPAWSATRYSGSSDKPGPLTELGKQLLEAMSELNMILDLSHIAETAYLECIETYPGPIIVSHSNPRSFLPTERGLSDKMIQILADHDGVIGIMPYNRFLKPDWRRGDPRESISRVVEAIDSVVQLIGNPAHVAIGSDFDGGFGVDSIPKEMDSVADLIKIAEALETLGYTRSDIEEILNGNWLRILNRCFTKTSKIDSN